MLVVVSLAAVLSKSGWIEPLAKVRTVSVPGFGRVTVTDGRGIIQTEVAGDGYDIGRVTQPLPALHRRWLPLARDVVGWSLRRAEQRGQPLHLTLGIDDRIFANSRLILAAQLWFHRFLPVDYLRAVSGRRYGRFVPPSTALAAAENALITGNPPPVTTITRKQGRGGGALARIRPGEVLHDARWEDDLDLVA